MLKRRITRTLKDALKAIKARAKRRGPEFVAVYEAADRYFRHVNAG